MEFKISFKRINCCSCQFQFAVPVETEKEWRTSHDYFHCPSCGQSQHFTGENDAEKYRKLYEQKDRCCSDLKELVDLRTRQFNGSKGAIGLLRSQRDDARKIKEPERSQP